MNVVLHEHSLTDSLEPLTERIINEDRRCGIIIASCPNLSQKQLRQLQTLSNKDNLRPAVCYGGHTAPIVAICTEEQSLAETHYLSLQVKEFLERRSLLSGPMYIAHYPESGNLTKEVLHKLYDRVQHAEDEEHDIRIYVDQAANDDISSILIADPEEVNRTFIRVRLELKGYRIYEASDGADALQKVARYSPDLVITELNLPTLDGYRLMHKLQDEYDGTSKIIVLTDKHLTRDMERAFAMGASDYMTKPFSISELEWRIRKL